MKLNNKNALITGASRGIGSATAKLFAQHGARVAVHYHQNEKAANQTLKQLAGDSHFVFKADLRLADDVQELVSQVKREMGGIDILVNSAGIYKQHPPLEIDYDQWQNVWNDIIKTNLLAPANLTYCVAKEMIKKGAGRIINISSRGAFRGEPKAPAYGASKAGLNAMGQSMAKELAPFGIYVYTIAPGFVDTDMAYQLLSGPEGKAIRNESPLGRAAKPEEIAQTALFLAAEAPEYLTGCIIDANGASYFRS